MSLPGFLTLIYIGAAALLMGLSVPLIQGRIPRNALYGFRTPKTLASDEVWYPANWYSGRCLFAAGAAMLIGAVLLRLFGSHLSKDAYAWTGLGVTMAPLLIALLKSLLFLRRL